MSERAWIPLPSGKQPDLLDPDPWASTDEDLAIGLSRTYRWAGYSAWDLPLSVAQHSLAVLALRGSRFAERPLLAAEARRELLHDATEALMGDGTRSHRSNPISAPASQPSTAACRRPSTIATTCQHGRPPITSRTSRPIGSPPPTRPITWSADRAPRCASSSGSSWLRSIMIRSICRRISGQRDAHGLANLGEQYGGLSGGGRLLHYRYRIVREIHGHAPSFSASSGKLATTMSCRGSGSGSGGPSAPHSSGRRTKAVR
jgi:hypothetical protein